MPYGVSEARATLWRERQIPLIWKQVSPRTDSDRGITAHAVGHRRPGVSCRAGAGRRAIGVRHHERDGTRTCNGVAKTLGYGKVSTLRAHLKRTFGVHARALQTAPTPESAIEALLDQPATPHGRGAAHFPPAAAVR